MCWFLDAGNDETLRRLNWPASKKRQGQEVAGSVAPDTAVGEDVSKAGCSMASATMASSISWGTRFFSTGFLRLISCNAGSPPLSYSSLKR
jgi:hypothetical protein